MKKKTRILLCDSAGKYVSIIESQLKKLNRISTLLLCNAEQLSSDFLLNNTLSLVMVNSREECLNITNIVRKKNPSVPIILIKDTNENDFNLSDEFDDVIAADDEDSIIYCLKKYIEFDKIYQLNQHFPADMDEMFLFTAFLNNANSIIAIFKPDGEIVYFSRGCSEVTGFLSEDVVGKNLWELLVPYDYREFVKNAFIRMEAGFNAPFIKIPMRTKSGEELFIYWSNTLYINMEDETEYIFSIGKDITSIAKSQKESELSKKFLQKVLNSINADVFVLNRRFGIVEANRNFIKEYSTDREIIGRKCYSVIYGFEVPCYKYGLPCPFEYIMRTFKNFKGESERNQDHKRVWEVLGSPVFNEKNGIANIVVFRSDITARKLIEEKINQDIEEKSVMLKEIHHRVNNNLQIISSLIGFEVSKISDLFAQGRMIVLRNRMRTMAMIHNQLYHSPELSEINISEHIRNFVIAIKRWYPNSGAEVRIVCSDKKINTSIEKAIPFGLILYELVSNALVHAYPNNSCTERIVEVELKKSEEIYVELLVKDRGIGIPPDIVHKATDLSGLYLANILAKDQLSGKLEINDSDGTQCILKFKLHEE